MYSIPISRRPACPIVTTEKKFFEALHRKHGSGHSRQGYVKAKYRFVGNIRKIFKSISSKLLPGHDPSFMIIGAQKAGTTSLHYYLDQHPKLAGSYPKELNYFSRDIFLGKDLNWYRKHFTSLTKPDAMFFESTPKYMNLEPVAQQIAKTYPNMKFIMILREPIARAYSGWNMYRSYSPKQIARKMSGSNGHTRNRVYKYLFDKRTAFPSFREVVDLELDFISRCSDEGPFILRKGLYVDQIKMYYRYFDADQILILAFRDLVTKPNETCNRVLEFLNVNGPACTFNIEPKNQREYPDKITGDDKKILEEFYLEPNRELRELLGRELNW
ncbi:MAG: sulfotransferase [Cyclobacteriaceae bacterium]